MRIVDGEHRSRATLPGLRLVKAWFAARGDRLNFHTFFLSRLPAFSFAGKQIGGVCEVFECRLRCEKPTTPSRVYVVTEFEDGFEDILGAWDVEQTAARIAKEEHLSYSIWEVKL